MKFSILILVLLIASTTAYVLGGRKLPSHRNSVHNVKPSLAKCPGGKKGYLIGGEFHCGKFFLYYNVFFLICGSCVFYYRQELTKLKSSLKLVEIFFSLYSQFVYYKVQ